jgi:hypothetical protein
MWTRLHPSIGDVRVLLKHLVEDTGIWQKKKRDFLHTSTEIRETCCNGYSKVEIGVRSCESKQI